MIRVSSISGKVAPSRIIDGVIVTSEKNTEFGSIMLEEVAFTNSAGFLNKQKRVAFLRSDLATLKDYVASFGLKAGSPVEGKIVVEESITPFFEGQTPKVNPTSGAVITSNGNAIYRNSYLGTTGDVDKLLASDKVVVEEVSEKTALAEMQL